MTWCTSPGRAAKRPAYRGRHPSHPRCSTLGAGPNIVAYVKRHPALEQLSRDHHQALVVAQRLKRASDATGTSARAGFVKYWEAEGRAHFREEEEILLPGCAGFVNPDEPIVAKVLTDHVRIRHFADTVQGVDRPGLDVLHDLGTQLEQHVRREERELFPLIEQSLPEAELDRLVALLAR
jgi:hypothetical protein